MESTFSAPLWIPVVLLSLNFSCVQFNDCVIGSETEIGDGKQLRPGNEPLIFREHFFKNSVQCSTPLVRQLHEAPDLPQWSINIEHSISHSGSWLCCFCSPGGLLKHLSDLWRVHLHGSGTGSTASMSPASQTLLNVWVRETRRSPSPSLSFCNCKNSSGSPDDSAAAAGQPLEGLKLRDFADDAACPDPYRPQTRDTVSWTGYMFVFWVSARCTVVLFVFLNFLLRVRAFRLDVSVFKKKKKRKEKKITPLWVKVEVSNSSTSKLTWRWHLLRLQLDLAAVVNSRGIKYCRSGGYAFYYLFI